MNGDDKTLITYMISFDVKNGTLQGFSKTDIGGLHETKSLISGTYNATTNMLAFQESQILYTKSQISQKDFCYVFFEGKLKLSANLKEIKGNFSSKYKDGKKCINGTLLLVNQKKIEKTISKLSTKIQSSKKLDTTTKKKFDLLNMADSLQVNRLLKNQNLSIFATSKTIIIEVWDNKKEDGDAINLYQNAKVVLKNYTVMNKKKIIEIPLTTSPILLKLEATNEGNYAPNTAMIRIIDGENSYELLSNLKKWESSSITIYR
ncbi:hypothetical protein [Flavobacterium sp.]|uniref:hypothetical protein n=1 Tax=Flavobacterium sp. TaxID=239 RepID=UPI0037BE79B8